MTKPIIPAVVAQLRVVVPLALRQPPRASLTLAALADARGALAVSAAAAAARCALLRRREVVEEEHGCDGVGTRGEEGGGHECIVREGGEQRPCDGADQTSCGCELTRAREAGGGDIVSKL